MTKAELLQALGAEAGAGAATEPGPDDDAGHAPGSDHQAVRPQVWSGDGDVRLRTLGPAPPDAADRTAAAGRRRTLNDRLAAYFDEGRHCPWTSIEGFRCGLPVIAHADRCALHGGIDIFDVPVPAAGRLGFDTWPTLIRHLLISSYDVDPLGLDPVVAEIAWHLTNTLYFEYFRVEVEGIEHIPTHGPAIIAANHGGAALPYDAFMLTAAVANEPAAPRRLRVIGTEIFNMLPWVSHLYRKVGGAYASRGDADYLLSRGRLVGVFPEGEKGFMKPVWDAYQVQRFGRGGFLSLAEDHEAPVVPVAIVGSEEVHPAVGVSEWLARLVRLIWPEQRVDQIAVVLNPIPLPVRWRIRFLPPLAPEGRAAVIDPLRMLERTEEVRVAIQSALDDILATRRGVF
jgi:1-acyl-sn-glycerol-3-phosphate acyltransferase